MKRVYLLLLAPLLLVAVWLLAQSFALGAWPGWLRLLVGGLGTIGMVVAGWLVVKASTNPPPTLHPPHSTLVAVWSAPLLAISTAQPAGVAGGLWLALNAALLMLAVANTAYRVPSRNQSIIYNLQSIISLWLVVKAALGNGELLTGGLLLIVPLLVLASGPSVRVASPALTDRTWSLQSTIYALQSVIFVLAGPLLLDVVLRPYVATLGGLPAWADLDLRPLAVGGGSVATGAGFLPPVGQPSGVGDGYLPVLALAVSFGVLLVVGWLLHRLGILAARMRRRDG